MTNKKNIALLISGGGGLMNRAIIESNRDDSNYNVKVVIGSSADCYGLTIAKKHNVLTHVIDFSNENVWEEKSKELFDYLDDFFDIEFVFLLGWLKKISLADKWVDKVFNIHPSLLPKYGGKGMYGYHVHQAVIDNKESESGFTLHSIDNEYDKGEIYFQYKIKIEDDETVDTLQDKVIALQHDKLFEMINSFACKI